MADIRSQPEQEDGWAEGTIKTVLLGDFFEHPTFTGLAVRATVSAVPFVDQVADVQDSAAWILLARDKGLEEFEVKISGFLLGIGWIPTVGSLGKGVLKALNSTSGAKAVIRMLDHLNFFSKVDGVKWLKAFSADLPQHAKKAAKLMQDVLDELASLMQKLKGYVPQRVMRKLDEWIASVRQVRDKVEGMFAEVAEHFKKKLDDALAQFKKADLDLESGTKTEVKRVQDATPPPRSKLPDNMKLPPSKADDVITSKYGKHLDDSKKGGGLADSNTIGLSDDEFRKMYGEGADNIDGFVDPSTGKIYVNVDKPYADSTVMHESLHKYANDDWRETVGTGFDEGVTEYMTKTNAKELGLDYAEGYPYCTGEAGRLAKTVGDDVLSEAYFSGNVDNLKGAYEAAKGKGSFDKLVTDFDTRLRKDTSY